MFRLLLSLRARQAANVVRTAGTANRLLIMGLVAFGLLLGVAVFGAFRLVFAMALDDAGRDGLIDSAMLFLLWFLLASAVPFVGGTLLQPGDTTLLAVAPVRPTVVMASRILDSAIDQISDIRAFLGAFANDNVEPTKRELEVHIENLQASESTIRDLDFAAETAELTRTQVLFQAGVSVLAQANALPQAVLQLLSGR